MKYCLLGWQCSFLLFQTVYFMNLICQEFHLYLVLGWYFVLCVPIGALCTLFCFLHELGTTFLDTLCLGYLVSYLC